MMDYNFNASLRYTAILKSNRLLVMNEVIITLYQVDISVRFELEREA
jgi:hypothetical protein